MSTKLTRSADDSESFFELTSREVDDDETLNIDLNDATGVILGSTFFDVVDVSEEFNVAMLPRSATSDSESS